MTQRVGALYFSQKKKNSLLSLPSTALISLPDRAEEEYGSGAYHFEYATDASFEKKKYSEDSTLNELLSNPEAGELFEKEMPYLAGSGFVKTFAGNLSVITSADPPYIGVLTSERTCYNIIPTN